MRRRLVLLVLLVLALAVLVAPADASAAKWIRVKWTETMNVNGSPVFTFNVRAIVLREGGGWTVWGSFKNHSTRTFPIRKRFALRVYEGRRFSSPWTQRLARRFSPAMPASIAPGQAWSGRFSGPGSPPNGHVRVIFGKFMAKNFIKDWAGFVWITDHRYRLRR